MSLVGRASVRPSIPYKARLAGLRSPRRAAFNDSPGHKLPDRSVARVEINAGLFVRNAHDPRGFGIERGPFNQSKPGHVPSAIHRLHRRMNLHGFYQVPDRDRKKGEFRQGDAN